MECLIQYGSLQNQVQNEAFLFHFSVILFSIGKENMNETVIENLVLGYYMASLKFFIYLVPETLEQTARPQTFFEM